MADPAAHREAVVAWYASWRGLLFWRPPAHSARHLDDPRCRSVARRRLVFGVIVPWLVGTALVLAANGIVVDTQVRIWWETPAQPGQRVNEHTVHRKDRLLNFNLHLHLFEGGLLWTPPAGAVEHEEPVERSVRIEWPDPDSAARCFILSPSAAVAPLAVLELGPLLVIGRRAPGVRRRAVPTLVAPFAAHYAVVAAGIVVAMGSIVAGQVFHVERTRALDHVAAATLLLSVILTFAAPARLTVAALRACRPRRCGYSTAVLVAASLLVLTIPALAMLACAPIL